MVSPIFPSMKRGGKLESRENRVYSLNFRVTRATGDARLMEGGNGAAGGGVSEECGSLTPITFLISDVETRASAGKMKSM